MDYPQGARNPVMGHAIQDGGVKDYPSTDGAALTLDRSNNHIRIELPQVAGVTRVFTLPPVGSWKGDELFIECYGTLVGVGVQVVCQSDGLVAYASGVMTAENDHIWLRNVAGRTIVQLAELITP